MNYLSFLRSFLCQIFANGVIAATVLMGCSDQAPRLESQTSLEAKDVKLIGIQLGNPDFTISTPISVPDGEALPSNPYGRVLSSTSRIEETSAGGFEEPLWMASAARTGNFTYSFQAGGGGTLPINIVGLTGVPCQYDIVMPQNRARIQICHGYQGFRITASSPQPLVYYLLVSHIAGQVLPGEGIYPDANLSLFAEDTIEIARPTDPNERIFFLARPAWEAWESGKFKPWRYSIQVWNGSTNKLLRQIPFPENTGREGGELTSAWDLTTIPPTSTGVGPGQLFRIRVISQGECQSALGDRGCGARIALGFLSSKDGNVK